jgi:hypothetical protein
LKGSNFSASLYSPFPTAKHSPFRDLRPLIQIGIYRPAYLGNSFKRKGRESARTDVRTIFNKQVGICHHMLAGEICWIQKATVMFSFDKKQYTDVNGEQIPLSNAGLGSNKTGEQMV